MGESPQGTGTYASATALLQTARSPATSPPYFYTLPAWMLCIRALALLRGEGRRGSAGADSRRSSRDPQVKREKRIAKRQELSEHKVRVFLAFLLSLSEPLVDLCDEDRAPALPLLTPRPTKKELLPESNSSFIYSFAYRNSKRLSYFVEASYRASALSHSSMISGMTL